MTPCRCAIKDRDGRVIVPRTGYVKFYVTGGAPGLPGWLKAVEHKGDGAKSSPVVRWLGPSEGYYLCRCPDCEGQGVVQTAPDAAQAA